MHIPCHSDEPSEGVLDARKSANKSGGRLMITVQLRPGSGLGSNWVGDHTSLGGQQGKTEQYDNILTLRVPEYKASSEYKRGGPHLALWIQSGVWVGSSYLVVVCLMASK